MATPYPDFHADGYWWAIKVGQDGQQPEIIYVFSLPEYGAWNKNADRLGEAYPCDIAEFIPLRPIDTTGWPERADTDSPEHPQLGHYWAIYDGDSGQPEIVR